MADEIDSLIKKLGSSVWTERSIAADRLSIVGDPRAAPALIRALRDAKDVVRTSAAEALGVICDPRAVEPLCKVLVDNSGGVQESVAESLVKIGKPSVGPLCKLLLSKRNESREIAADTLIRIGPAAVVSLINLLEIKDKEARIRASALLASIGPPSDLPKLILLSPRMSAQERAADLQALHQLKRGNVLQRTYHLDCGVLQYCEEVAQGVDPDARKEAEAVIRYLSLLRPSQNPGHDLLRAASGEEPGTPPSELLRPASFTEPTTAPNELLRSGDIPVEPVTRKLNFMQRLRGVMRGNQSE